MCQRVIQIRSTLTQWHWFNFWMSRVWLLWNLKRIKHFCLGLTLNNKSFCFIPVSFFIEESIICSEDIIKKLMQLRERSKFWMIQVNKLFNKLFKFFFWILEYLTWRQTSLLKDHIFMWESHQTDSYNQKRIIKLNIFFNQISGLRAQRRWEKK